MKLSFTKTAMKDVRKIKDIKQQDKIEEAILELKKANEIQEISSIKKLKGHPFAYRKRVGDYRIGLVLREDELIVSRVLKRADIYKVFP